MAGLTISEAALRVGLNASTIRYYERIGLVAPPSRVSGQRRYDLGEVDRLTVIRRARQLGFTVDEVRQLCRSALDSGPAEGWRTVSIMKLAELERKIEEMKGLQVLLKNIVASCKCQSIDECGRRMRQKLAGTLPADGT